MKPDGEDETVFWLWEVGRCEEEKVLRDKMSKEKAITMAQSRQLNGLACQESRAIQNDSKWVNNSLH
jgi:hypothetical protein